MQVTYPNLEVCNTGWNQPQHSKPLIISINEIGNYIQRETVNILPTCLQSAVRQIEDTKP